MPFCINPYNLFCRYSKNHPCKQLVNPFGGFNPFNYPYVNKITEEK